MGANNCREHFILGKKISVQGFKTKETQKVIKTCNQAQPSKAWKTDSALPTYANQVRINLSSTTESINAEYEFDDQYEDLDVHNFGMPRNFACQRFAEITLVVPAESEADNSRLHIQPLPEPQGCQISAPFSSQRMSIAFLKPSLVGTSQKIRQARPEFYSSLILRSLLIEQAAYEDIEQNYRFNIAKMPQGAAYLGR
jgi:hypothetical protein